MTLNTRERRLAGEMKRNSQSRVFKGRGWSLCLACNIMLAAVCCLFLVWAGIERMDINYFINLEQHRYREKMELNVKLQVERERLVSPYELLKKAQEYGMKQPLPGQIRRLYPERAQAGRVK